MRRWLVFVFLLLPLSVWGATISFSDQPWALNSSLNSEIAGVNTTANIKSLGFNQTGEYDVRYCFGNGTNCVSASLTLGQVNTNMGNYSANPSGFYNTTTLPAYPVGDNQSWNETRAGTLYYGRDSNIHLYYNASTIPAYLLAESDPAWTGNSTLYLTIVAYNLNAPGYYNVTTLPVYPVGDNQSWNQSGATVLFYPRNTNPQSFYNATTLPVYPVGDNQSWNETRGNAIYYLRTDGLLDNQTFNQSLTTTLYYPRNTNPQSFYNVTTLPVYPVGDNQSWNQSYANTLYASISVVTDNQSWNQSGATVLFYPRNTNPQSFYNITTLPAYPAADNTSWNQSYANTLYASITVVTDNQSWNQSGATILFYPRDTNPLGFYNSTNPPPGGNASWNETRARVIALLNNGTLTSTDWCRWNSNAVSCDVVPLLQGPVNNSDAIFVALNATGKAQFTNTVNMSNGSFTNVSGCTNGLQTNAQGLVICAASAAGGAPTTSAYLTWDVESSLSNDVSLGTDAFFYATFLGDAVDVTPTILGTETVSTVDVGRYGVHNFASAAATGGDAGYSFGSTTVTTTRLYNASSMRIFETSTLFDRVNNLTFALGVLGTTTTQVLNSTNNSIAFWYNISQSRNVSCMTCASGTCTINITNVILPQNAFLKYAIKRVNAGEFDFYINDTLKCQATNNIPKQFDSSWIGTWGETFNATAFNMRMDYMKFAGDRVLP